MKLVIIDLYGDGESLRVCEDKPGIDRALADFLRNEESDENFDDFAERKGITLFLTRCLSLEHSPSILGTNPDLTNRRCDG